MTPRASIARRAFLKASAVLGLPASSLMSPSAASAWAPADAPADATLEVPMMGLIGQGPFFSVARIDPDGTVGLELSKNLAPQARKVITGLFTEGYYLLLVPSVAGSKGPGIFRAQVTEVAEGPAFVIALAPEATRQLEVGRACLLVRPFRATTAQMRSLPGIVPMSGGEGELPDGRMLARRAQSINNLKQIGLAMHNFHSTQDRFPAAVIYGPDGRPWHSWRVLILPYLEQAALFNEYDFNQPWDSEKNRQLIPRMPAVYRDPAYGDARGSHAHYAALVGDRAMFPPEGARQPGRVGATVPMGEGGRRLAEITDGTSNTWMVAPLPPEREVPWTKPEDLKVGPDFPGLGKPGGIATPYTLGGKEDAPGVAPILYVDGSVLLVSATINQAVLNALTTCGGGEVISRDAIPQDAYTIAVERTLRLKFAGGRASAELD